MTSGGIAIARVRQPKLGLSGSERTSEGTGGRPAASRNALVSPFNRSRCWTSEVARSRGFLSKTATMDKKLIFSFSLSVSLKISYPAGQTYEQSCGISLPPLTELVGRSGFLLLLCSGSVVNAKRTRSGPTLPPMNQSVLVALRMSGFSSIFL